MSIVLMLITTIAIFSNLIGALSLLYFSLIIVQGGQSNRTIGCNRIPEIGQLHQPIILERFSIECQKNLANFFGFVLLHSVINSKFSRHFFNQSEVTPKPIVASAGTFSRAFGRLRVITRV